MTTPRASQSVAAEPLETTWLETAYGRVRVADQNSSEPDVPLVFVHGYPDNLQIWSRVIRQLTGRRCIAFDWPGLGHSDSVVDGATPFHLGRHFLAVVDALGLDQVIPVGFDMGAHAVAVAATTAPDRFAALVLTNFLADGKVATSWDIAVMRQLGLNRLVLRYGASVVFARALQTFLDKEELDSKTRDDLRTAFQRPEVRTHLRRMCAGYQAALPRVSRLYPAINCETLVIWANGDSHFPPSQGRALAAALPNAEIKVIDAPHWYMWERPDLTATLIRQFVADR